jgi:predicted RNase H-like HicB family nuclease
LQYRNFQKGGCSALELAKERYVMKIAPEFRIYFAQTEDGKWVAASNEAPFFCFEGDSEEEVERLAARALDMYERTDLPAPVMKSRTITISSFSHSKIKRRKELAAA